MYPLPHDSHPASAQLHFLPLVTLLKSIVPMKFGSKEAASHPWGPAHPQQDAQQGARPIPLMGKRPEAVGTLGRKGLQFQWKCSQRASCNTPGHLWQEAAVVQSPIGVQLFVTPGTAAHQVSLPFTSSGSLLKLMSVESVMLTKPLHGIQPCHGEGVYITQ